MAEFGAWMRDKRKLAGLTQKQVAAQVKCVTDTISRRERGKGGRYLPDREDEVEIWAIAIRAEVHEAISRWNEAWILRRKAEAERTIHQNGADKMKTDAIRLIRKDSFPEALRIVGQLAARKKGHQ